MKSSEKIIVVLGLLAAALALVSGFEFDRGNEQGALFLSLSGQRSLLDLFGPEFRWQSQHEQNR